MTTQVRTVYVDKMKRLVLEAGGIIEEERYVTQPGCVVVSESTQTEEGARLCEALHIDRSRPEYEQRAEFSSRVTYLSFPEAPQQADQYNEKMARVYQHLSVHSSTVVQFLIAGISIETSLELIAHGEAKVGRLTSSKTKAMDETLYRLIGSSEEQAAQKRCIEQFIPLREQWKNEGLKTEFMNMLNLPLKCTALTYTMNLKDFHKLFIGRLSEHGNETEVQEICRMMCAELHKRYPLVIRTPHEYYEMNNGAKYGD